MNFSSLGKTLELPLEYMKEMERMRTITAETGGEDMKPQAVLQVAAQKPHERLSSSTIPVGYTEQALRMATTTQL